jgi:hypothetical protein
MLGRLSHGLLSPPFPGDYIIVMGFPDSETPESRFRFFDVDSFLAIIMLVIIP